MISARFLSRGVLAPIAAFSALFLAGAPAAVAHDSVIGSTPANGEAVEKFPRHIELEFSGLPQDGFATVALSDQDSGEVLFSGEPTIEDRIVTLELPETVTGGPGDYTVGFQIVSSDGHATRNTTTFTVAGNPASSPSATAGTSAAPTEDPGQAKETAAAEDTSSGAGRLIALVLAGVVIFALIAGAIMMIVRRRNTGE